VNDTETFARKKAATRIDFAREETCPEILAEVVSVAQLLRLEGRRTKQFQRPAKTDRAPTGRLVHRNPVRASGFPQERDPLLSAAPSSTMRPTPLSTSRHCRKNIYGMKADKAASHAGNLPAGGRRS
jgi:hypothetical protein